MEIWQGPLEKIDDYRWRIPMSYKSGMRVPGIIYASEKLLESICRDKSPEQVANVAFLPGIVKASLAMPDIHWGYGPSIGAVFATDPREGGIVTPSGVGYDINCGVRLIRSELTEGEVRPRIKALMEELFNKIPCGVGSSGDIRLSYKEQRQMLAHGARWVIEKGYGWPEDSEHTEAYGAMKEADPDRVMSRAYERGKNQLGTLGAGNHFLEVQVVEEVYNEEIARAFGIFKGQVTVMIHSGSRGFGYQVCDDYLRVMGKAMAKYGIAIPDRQLACVPADSSEGRDYFSAMACAANYAWANRQCMMHWTRESFEKVFGKDARTLGLSLVYDVAHNIAKFEEHDIDGRKVRLCVHRKGATRAFPRNHPDLPETYRPFGQPVIIPGDMGRNSYLLVGTDRAAETFYSTCHGAGRLLSRKKAIARARGRFIDKELGERGITVMARSRSTLGEEASEAYKDVNVVVDIVHCAGISKKVAKLKPLGVMKG